MNKDTAIGVAALTLVGCTLVGLATYSISRAVNLTPGLGVSLGISAPRQTGYACQESRQPIIDAYMKLREAGWSHATAANESVHACDYDPYRR